jgi:hypothetical protein
VPLGRWQSGSSGITWDKSGCDHPPLTLGRLALEEAASDAATWLEEQHRECRGRFEAARNLEKMVDVSLAGLELLILG